MRTADELFKKYIQTLSSIIDFEEFYVSFGQLINDWRINN